MPAMKRRWPQMSPAWRAATALTIVLIALAHYKLYQTFWASPSAPASSGGDAPVVHNPPRSPEVVVPNSIDQRLRSLESREAARRAAERRQAQAAAVPPATSPVRRSEPPDPTRPEQPPPAAVAAGTRPQERQEFARAEDAVLSAAHMKKPHVIFSLQNISSRTIVGLRVSIYNGSQDQPLHTFDVPRLAGNETMQGDIDLGVDGAFVSQPRLKIDSAKFQ